MAKPLQPAFILLIAVTSVLGFLVLDEQVATVSTPTDTGNKTTCNSSAEEIVFVLDASGSVGHDNFNLVKDFVKTVIRSLNIGTGPNQTRVGLITYSTNVVMQIKIQDNHTLHELEQAVDNIVYSTGGKTETEKALNLLITEGFQGMRPGTRKTAIVITDGLSTQPNLTQQTAKAARDSGILIFAIGVGNQVNMDELNGIAKDTKQVFLVDDFNALSGMVKQLTQAACEAIRPTVTCMTKVADVVFLIDSSGSVGFENFEKMKQFVQQVVEFFDVGTSYTNVGLIVFNDRPKIEFQLNKYQTKSELIAAINQLVYSQGGTNTATALETLRTDGFAYDRPNAPNIAIVVTDGLSKNPDATKIQAILLKEHGITVFAIGVGNHTNRQELDTIASSPNPRTKYVFEVGDFDTLKTLDAIVAHSTCGVQIGGIPYMTTTSSSATSKYGCYDAIDGCETYGRDACSDYEPWARAHCMFYCGFCPHLAMTGTTTEAPCDDNIRNCHEYGTYICTEISMIEWTTGHCKKYCGLCGNGSLPHENPTTPTPMSTTTSDGVCRNRINNCHEYNNNTCTEQSYRTWAQQNCAEFCGFCSNYNVIKGIQSSTGNYTCPDWKLPKECIMTSIPGSACPMPSCPPGYTLTVELPKH
ncbi:hypothetical protein ACJMK2_043322 [Sinanodonta woodiana]|uniref:VWFA domain-containing protein n=1 Tax=Sinanodonta woodiana TaxID=1069815 RepID=A0ABD3VXB3_SINWO